MCSTLDYKDKVETVSNFLAERYPDKNLKILDVASGQDANLTLKLREIGYKDVTPVDPDLQKDFKGGRKRLFTRLLCMDLKPDLLVSIWPCYFTENLIQIARECGVPLVLYPCPCTRINGKAIHSSFKYSIVVRQLIKLYNPKVAFPVRSSDKKRYMVFIF